jgi:hypothetical protein
MRKQIIALTTLIGVLFGLLLPSGFTVLGDVISGIDGSPESLTNLIFSVPLIIFIEVTSGVICGFFGMLTGFIIEISCDIANMSSGNFY